MTSDIWNFSKYYALKLKLSHVFIGIRLPIIENRKIMQVSLP